MKFSIKVERHIFSPKIFSPTSRIDNVMLENNVTNCSTINREQFNDKAHKKSLNTNCTGFWTCESVKCDSIRKNE